MSFFALLPSVTFSNGKSVLGLNTPKTEDFKSPQNLMSEMGRIDFLVFIGDTGTKPL